MARKKSQSQFPTFRSVGLFGALAAAAAGGGYFAGKKGVDIELPPKIAALLSSDKLSALRGKGASETKQAEAKPAEKQPETHAVRQTDKSELARMLKTADATPTSRIPPSRKTVAAKVEARNEAKSDTRTETKAETSETKPVKEKEAKTEAKSEAAKAESAKATAKADAKSEAKTEARAEAPVPAAEIPMPPNDAPAKARKEVAEQKDTAEKEASTQKEGSPLAISLLDKGIPTSEDSKVRFSVGFENLAGKPIRAFEGVLKFTDRQNKALFSSKISVSALISDGATLQWDERLDPSKLDASKAKRLIDEDKENLKAVFQVKKIFFVDGSVQQFGAKG